MEIFNSTFGIWRQKTGLAIHAPSLTIFVYSRAGRYPHIPGEHQRDRYDTRRRAAATAKDAEVYSLCHFAGQNRSGRGRNDLGKRARSGTRITQSSE